MSLGIVRRALDRRVIETLDKYPDLPQDVAHLLIDLRSSLHVEKLSDRLQARAAKSKLRPVALTDKHGIQRDGFEFCVSNGVTLSFSRDGLIDGPPKRGDSHDWDHAMIALIEADRDEQIVTWRWPEDENFVVIRNEALPLPPGETGRWVYAYDARWFGQKIRGEHYGKSWYCSDWSAPPSDPHERSAHAAAHAYFQAVPMGE